MPRGVYKRTKPGHAPPTKGKGKCITFIRQTIVGKWSRECILWPYSVDFNGYGQFGVDGKIYRAHKYVCRLVHGEPPIGYEAAHSCGVARCINPKHLSWKTRSANELDKRRHGTQGGGAKSARGNGGSRTNLTPEQIADIRANKGKVPALVLARRHGIKRGGVRYWQDSTHQPVPPGRKRRMALSG